MKLLKPLTLTALSTLIVSCGVQPIGHTHEHFQAAYDSDNPSVKVTRVLAGIAQLVDEGRLPLAKQYYKKLNYREFNHEQSSDYLMLGAYLSSEDNQCQVALNKTYLARRPSALGLELKEKVEQRCVLMIRYPTHHQLDDTFDEMSAQLHKDPERLWQLLTQTPTSPDQHGLSENSRGYLQLAQAYPQPLLLAAWPQQFPQHAATSLFYRHPTPMGPFNHWLVFLPLSGQHADIGHAIERGLLAAHFEGKTPYHLHIIDTDTPLDMAQLIADEQPDVILGSLTRDMTEQLLQQAPHTPMILLAPSGKLGKHQYYLNLSLATRGQWVAEQLYHQGLLHPLVIQVDQPSDVEKYQAFRKQWAAYGQEVVSTATLKPEDEGQKLQQAIEELLAIDTSKARIQNLMSDLDLDLNITPSRRHDFNAIVIFADEQKLDAIKSFTDYYYSDDIPVFTPELQSKEQHPISPWISAQYALSDLPLSHIAEGVEATDKENLFFGVGIDLYYLVDQQLPLSDILKVDYMKGATGTLKMSTGPAIDIEYLR